MPQNGWESTEEHFKVKFFNFSIIIQGIAKWCEKNEHLLIGADGAHINVQDGELSPLF